AKNYGLAVRSPPVDLVVVAPARRQRATSRIVCKLPRNAAGDGNDVNLLIAVVLAGEGNPLPVRREFGKKLDTRMRRQACGESTGGGGQPQIAAVCEYDFIAMNVWKTQQLGLRLKRADQRQCGDQTQEYALT